jgi:Uncharacterized protein conserved in bacteria (DUF2252)
MASDLAASTHTGITLQLRGDAHVDNFGLFASPERSLVFDINDFDETLPGPWEWDVKRLVAGLAVVGASTALLAQIASGRYALARRRTGARADARADGCTGRLVCPHGDRRELEAGVNPTFAQAIRRTAATARSRDNLSGNVDE